MAGIVIKTKSVIIKTADGAITLRFRNGFDADMTAKYKQAQKVIDSEVLRRSDPYVPFDTGSLKRSGITGTVIGSGLVSYTAPYAKRQYYTNAGKGRQGLNASRSSGLRGRLWFERMKADQLNDLLRKVGETFG